MITTNDGLIISGHTAATTIDGQETGIAYGTQSTDVAALKINKSNGEII